ncbi:MAG: two-component regulator propeller domain-containing protein [Ferruginibacter sp.]
MKYVYSALFILVFTLASGKSSAQNQNAYLIKKVNLKGVPIETNFSSVIQDDDGFLWLGGLNGLYRFDGSRVTRFLRDPADTNSLTHNYASTLAKDRKGNIWIGTFGGFMNKYDRQSGKIKRIEPWEKNQARKVVRKTKIALDGNIIAATANGLFKINPGGTVTDSILIPSTLHLMNAGITDFLEYENDQFIITATTGLFQLNWKTRDMHIATFLASGKHYSCVEKDNEGNFWIGSDSSLTVVKKDFSLAGKFDFDGDTLLKNSPVNCMQKDSAGRIWIGTNTGLFLTGHKKIQKINPATRESPGKIDGLFIDNKATVWIYSEGNGLYQVYQPGIVFQTIPGIELYSKNQLIQSILEEKPGTWFIGTKFGLYRYSFSSKSFEQINFTDPKNKPWIGAQLMDKNGGHWVGTFGQGVFYRAPGTNIFSQFTYQQKNENSIPFNTVVALAEDNKGNIWMGSFSSGNQTYTNALCYYDPAKKSIHRLTGIGDVKTFKAVAISQIETDDQHHVWIGTWDGGLYKHYGMENLPQENSFSNYTETSAGPQKISHNIVSCIRPGKNGKICFGTISGGLNVLDTKSDSISWYTVRNGLSSNLVYRIEEDDQGMLWLSTDNGIARFDPTTKSFINYNTTSGLPANNFAFLTSVKCTDGTIVFGTNDGQVVYFNPNSSKNLINTKPVVITDIRLFNKSLETGSASLLQKAAYLTDTLHLNYDHSVISCELSNMDFLNPEIYTYAYKLEGFDKDWTYITDRNSITYTNLNPGTYTLLVKNADHLGIWNEKPTKLVLIIKPPFWQRWWFVSLVILAVAALVYILFLYRLKQKLRVLQVRNRLHRDLHDDVGATLSSVKAYSEILSENPNNPVIAELIKDNSTEMLERLEVISWATDPHHDNFKSLKSRMAKFATPLCHAKNIRYNFESKGINDEMLMPGEVRQNIFLVFKEAINNMVKYADATACNTQLFIRESQFVLQVTDNGKGFDRTIRGTGSGWKNMRKRTVDLSGRLVIDSTLQNGTDITMQIPYPFKIPNSWDIKKD